MKNSNPGRLFIILLLGSLTTVTPFSIDMYLPAFSQIAKDFHTSTAKVSLSITSYFIGIAIGQLLYGPLLDKFGRKKPLYVGLIIYIAASIGCLQSQSVEVLIAFRFVQALGGCVAMVDAMTMVRDFFPVEESAKIFSLLMLILGLSPLLAPTAGGFIITSLGWHAVFIVLSVIVLIILLLAFFFLPEKHKPDPTVSLRFKPMITTFLEILKTRVFYTYTLAGALSFASLFLYVAGSPVIFLEIFHVKPTVYGGIFAFLSVGFIGSNQLNILLLRKYKSERIFQTALICQFIIAIIFFIGTVKGWYGLGGTIAVLFVLLSCLGFTYPNASAVALTPITKNMGSASALLGFLQIGIAGAASASIGLFNSKSSAPVIGMMVITSFVALVILLVGRRKANS
ncbi:MAG: multidrug effflux MFS transporter [Chitinophagaceae bacterium]